MDEILSDFDDSHCIFEKLRGCYLFIEKIFGLTQQRTHLSIKLLDIDVTFIIAKNDILGTFDQFIDLLLVVLSLGISCLRYRVDYGLLQKLRKVFCNLGKSHFRLAIFHDPKEPVYR